MEAKNNNWNDSDWTEQYGMDEQGKVKKKNKTLRRYANIVTLYKYILMKEMYFEI